MTEDDYKKLVEEMKKIENLLEVISEAVEQIEGSMPVSF